jgi:hypothetical protein
MAWRRRGEQHRGQCSDRATVARRSAASVSARCGEAASAEVRTASPLSSNRVWEHDVASYGFYMWYPGPWNGDVLAQGSIELIEYPYQQGASFFGSLSRKNLQDKCAWLEAIWDGWPTGKFSRVRMSKDKVCTKDLCWSVGIIYDFRELTWVCTVGTEIGRGVIL